MEETFKRMGELAEALHGEQWFESPFREPEVLDGHCPMDASVNGRTRHGAFAQVVIRMDDSETLYQDGVDRVEFMSLASPANIKRLLEYVATLENRQ